MNMMNTQMICLATALSAVSAAALDKVAVRQVAEGEQATEASAFGAPSDTGYLIHGGKGGYSLPANRVLDNATVKLIAAADFPGYLDGPGEIEVRPRGLTVIIR